MPTNSSDSSLPAEPGGWLGAACAASLCLVLLGLDQLLGKDPQLIGLFAVPPLLAAALTGARTTALVGGLAFGCAVADGVLSTDRPPFAAAQLIRLAAIVAVTIAAVITARLRQRNTQRIAVLSRLADVAQAAVLREIPPHMQQVQIGVRYVSASAEAHIGGDLYEALDTPYGVRVIIGDVRGKGLDAVRLASTVLGSFRHVAFERADLRNVVPDLDRAVARAVGDEDFVTAALIEIRGGQLSIVNCGHPAPLLIRDGVVRPLDPPHPAPPLGFLPMPEVRLERLEAGDRILLFTDGLAEARRDGAFFPIEERAAVMMGSGTIEEALTALENALRHWVRGLLADDIALVALEHTGTTREAVPPPPAWAWDTHDR